MKRRHKIRPSTRRDQDYRGQKTTVDWSKLTYMVKRGKPGALEVLQDAIETYFPKQFEEAKQEAIQSTKESRYLRANNVIGSRGQTYLVYFDSRIARRRFTPEKDVRSLKSISPFLIRPTHSYTYRMAGLQSSWVAVWSGHETNPRPTRHHLRRRLQRPDFWDREELVWYNDKNKKRVRSLVYRGKS